MAQTQCSDTCIKLAQTKCVPEIPPHLKPEQWVGIQYTSDMVETATSGMLPDCAIQRSLRIISNCVDSSQKRCANNPHGNKNN